MPRSCNARSAVSIESPRDAARCVQASGPGTVSYAAPEALKNNQVSPASDMFSFGCVLWELLSLKEPWSELGGQAFQIMSKIIYEKCALGVCDIPEGVRNQVRRCLGRLVLIGGCRCKLMGLSRLPSGVRAVHCSQKSIWMRLSGLPPTSLLRCVR